MTQICIRDMSTGSVVPLAGTKGGHSPFFSPDGAVLAFFAEGKLKKTPSAGGVVDSLADAPNPYGGTWADDGWIYFTRHSQKGIHKVKADAVGGVEVVTASLARMPEVGASAYVSANVVPSAASRSERPRAFTQTR